MPAVTPVRLPERAKPRPRKSTPPIAVAKSRERPQLSREEMLKIYRTMYLSRKLDDKEIQMKGQNRIFFQVFVDRSLRPRLGQRESTKALHRCMNPTRYKSEAIDEVSAPSLTLQVPCYLHVSARENAGRCPGNTKFM